MTTEPRTEIERYTPSEIEQRWQERWEADGLYRTPDHVEGRDNWYALTMFPYTSGDLHIGHWFAMAPSDALARYRRMRGLQRAVPHGLRRLRAARRERRHQGRRCTRSDWTDANIERMRGQLKRMGAMFDWSAR